MAYKRILIAEDDMRNANMIMSELIEKDYSCTVVDNSSDLMRLALGNTMKFDLIITDIIMPQGNGDEVVRTLRNLGIDTPVILISGLSDFEPPEGVIFFKKPYSLAELFTVVDKMLED
ncbi:MAG: response regulator transcription factor [Planctomycetota bacterium]|jgi:DNA-binding response OmpR family regulator